MRVEFSPTPNPYGRDSANKPPILTTSSLIRSEFARSFGILINNFHPEVLELILKAINEKEEKTQREIREELGNHHSVFPIRRSNHSPLILLELVTDKAIAGLNVIFELISQGWDYNRWGDVPTSFTTVDSAWALSLTLENPGDIREEAIFIQKPKDREGMELIIENLKAASIRSEHLQSISAVCNVEIKKDGTCSYRHSLIVIDYGKLNPDFDWQKLGNLIMHNGHFAGGFSTLNLFKNFPEIIAEGESDVKIQIITGDRQNNKTVPQWSNFIKKQQILRLSKDAANIEKIIAMSIGLIPS